MEDINESKFQIIYKNDMDSRNKLVQFIINLILESNVNSEVNIDEYKNSNRGGSD